MIWWREDIGMRDLNATEVWQYMQELWLKNLQKIMIFAILVPVAQLCGQLLWCLLADSAEFLGGKWATKYRIGKPVKTEDFCQGRTH